MGRPISVAWRDRPFDGNFNYFLIEPEVLLAERPTIADIVENIPNLPAGFILAGEVRLNGDLVPRDRWACVRARAERSVDISITLHMPLRDGGGGRNSGKQTIALVASIAVLLAAAVVTAGAAEGLAGLAPGWLAAGSYSAQIAGAGIGIGGMLLVTALFKPPSLSIANAAPTTQKPGGDLSASLQGNVQSPGAAVPRVLGTMRVFPPFLTPPLLEVVGEDVYAEAVYGLAGPHTLTGIQSNGVDITDISFRNQITLETQEGVLNTVQTLVSRQGNTDQLNIELSKHKLRLVNSQGGIIDTTINISDALPQWHQMVTRDSPDEFWIAVNFPSSLSCPGNPTDRSIALRLRFRLQGSSTWVNAPELHVARDQSLVSPFTREIRLKWATFPAVTNAPPDSTGSVNGWIYAFKNVPTQAGGHVPAGIGGWTADSSFSLGAGGDLLSSVTAAAGTSNLTNVELNVDRAVLYLNPAVFPQGTYEVQVMRGFSYVNSRFTPTATTYPYNDGTFTGTIDFFGYVALAGGNSIDQNVVGVYDTAVVERVSSVYLQNPIQSGDFATISARVTKRSLGQLSVLASGYVHDWDGSGWNTLTTTSNPAPHFREVLAGNLGGSPIPTSIIDDAGLVDWRTACTSLGYNCNAVIEGRTYIDVLGLIAACGYATLRASETWGIVRDRDRSGDTPIQVFTPRNSSNFRWQKALPRQPTGFRISYINSVRNYVPDEEIIFADDSNQDATYLEAFTYDGLVTKAEVQVRALHDLVQGRERVTTYSLDTDLDALVCQRGDLVGVQHDILSEKAGFARISSVQTSGGNVTGLTFEGTVTVDTEQGIFQAQHLFNTPSIFKLGSRTGVAIRLFGGAGILVKEITGAQNGEIQTVTFVTPFADPGRSVLDADCLCAIGPLGLEMRRLLVQDIDPRPEDFTATLSFVDEAPDLWS